MNSETTRQQLETRLQFNGIHSDHKKVMSDSDLSMLANTGYVDVSWSNDESASFLSPCGHYQVFFGGYCDTDPIYAQHICDDGYTTPITLTNDMSEALTKVEAFCRIYREVKQ